ncbi:MAG: class I SAM-dependent methyltransferase, partial [Planctomycetota bacterium]
DQSVDFYDPDRYQRRDEERLFPHLRPLAKAGRMRLLDAFCGAGREAKLFAVEGWHVTAFDGNAGMIDAARQQSADEEHRIHYLTCDFDAFETDEPFDIVYTSLWMYSTVQTPGKRDAFLRRCLDWVSDEGVVVISIVSDRQDHRVSAGLRFLVSRLVGLCTLGNARVQWGERFYDGLFWHHLDDQTVRQEITRARGTVTQVVPGDGITPNFYIFQSSTRKQAPTTERAA